MKLKDYEGKKFKPKKHPNMIILDKKRENKVRTVRKIARGEEKESKNFYFVHWEDGTAGPFENAKGVKWYFNEYFFMVSKE